MAIGRTNAGGGGAVRSFDVKGYATDELLLAATPKKNTIGVITDVPITSWIFSATEPDAPEAGRVWILTGQASAVAFNALKKNDLQVYPISAKQYINGAWVAVPAKSYLGGAWLDWTVHLYNAGDQCEDVTGGWFSYPDNNTNYVVFNKDNIQFVNGSNTTSAAAIYTRKAIDIARFKNLDAKGTVTDFDSDHIKIGITRSNTTGNDPVFIASTTVSKTGSMEAALDLSGVDSGRYYVAVLAKYANFKIDEIMLT